MIESKSWDWTKNTDGKWQSPARDAYYLSHRWKDRGFESLLDLGCGMGRHALFFAGQGFSVDAVDLSDYAVEHVGEAAARENLKVSVRQCDMLHLPFEDGRFDGVMAYNVIYHTDTAGFAAALREITRVLKPGGELYITLITKNSLSFMTAEQETFIDDNSIIRNESETEPNVPHFYISSTDVDKYFSGYKLLHPLVEQRFYDNDKGSSHFVIHGEKRI